MPPARTYDFRYPLNMASVDNALLCSLVATAAFRRLEGVSFLGAIDYSLVRIPNGSPSATRYTRAQHSLGVLRLALTYCAARHLSPEDSHAVCAAALLHDIGHPPLSHSMETVLAEQFGMDHHRAAEDIICGRIKLGREVFEILRAHKVDIERVVALVACDTPAFDRFFSGPISFDTIEGISRSYRYLKPRVATPSPHDIAIAAMERQDTYDRDLVDNFWNRKHEVYSCLVHSQKGILADFASRELLRRHAGQICKEDCFSDEKHMFNKILGLKDILTSRSMEEDVRRRIGTPDAYTARTYYVDQAGEFYSRQDDVRYRHVKYVRRKHARQNGKV